MLILGLPTPPYVLACSFPTTLPPSRPLLLLSFVTLPGGNSSPDSFHTTPNHSLLCTHPPCSPLPLLGPDCDRCLLEPLVNTSAKPERIYFPRQDNTIVLASSVLIPPLLYSPKGRSRDAAPTLCQHLIVRSQVITVTILPLRSDLLARLSPQQVLAKTLLEPFHGMVIDGFRVALSNFALFHSIRHLPPTLTCQDPPSNETLSN